MLHDRAGEHFPEDCPVCVWMTCSLGFDFRLWTVEAGDDSFHGYCLPVLDLKQEKEKKKNLCVTLMLQSPTILCAVCCFAFLSHEHSKRSKYYSVIQKKPVSRNLLLRRRSLSHCAEQYSICKARRCGSPVPSYLHTYLNIWMFEFADKKIPKKHCWNTSGFTL